MIYNLNTYLLLMLYDFRLLNSEIGNDQQFEDIINNFGIWFSSP